MGDLYYLSFRDVASPASTGVTSAEVYMQPDVDDALDWQTAALTGKNWVPWDQVAQVFRGRRVCFVLHGFNVPFEAGVQSCGPAAQFYQGWLASAVQMTGADLVVPVLWPGDGFIGWSYLTATQHTKAIGANFATFLASAAFTGREVSFISHSLGARVVLETVSQALDPTRPKPQAPFGTAILMAPAVDNDALDDPFAAATGPGGLKRVVVMSSPTDSVLSGWFKLGDFVEQALWWGFKGNTHALGLVGPTFTSTSSARGLSEWYEIGGGQDHGDYLPVGSNPTAQVWGPKPLNTSVACSDAMNLQPFAMPQLHGWATDRTSQFRPAWTPKF